MFNKKRKTVDKVVQKSYWEGFMRCLGGIEDENYALEYPILPKWYNEAYDIGYREGVRYCKEVIAKRKEGEGRQYCSWWQFTVTFPDIPGHVYAEAYGAARIAK